MDHQTVSTPRNHGEGEVRVYNHITEEKQIGSSMQDEQDKLLIQTEYPNKLLQVCPYIMIIELFERLGSYYVLQVNLTVYLQKYMRKSPAFASMMSSLFSSSVYIAPLFGGYAADAKFGLYRTISYFSILYLLGFLSLSLASLPSLRIDWLFYLCLFGLISLGAGAIKSNVITLGADQFDLSDPNQVDQLSSFFSYFYWTVNFGAIFASAYLSNFALSGSDLISSDYSFTATFFIATGMFAFGVTLFFAFHKRFIRKAPMGSALAQFSAIVLTAAKQSSRGIILLSGFFLLCLGVVMNCMLVFVPNGSSTKEVLTICNGGLILIGILLCIFLGRKVDWLDSARSQYPNKQVDNAWQMLRMLPYFASMISFWVVYLCMGGQWTNQGCQMDSRVFSYVPYSPASWAVWDALALCFLIPVFDRIIYPVVGKFLKNPNSPTSLQKMGAGFMIIIMSMLTSGVIEMERKNRPIIRGLDSICAAAGDERVVSSMTIWYQLPQYIMLATGEIFTSITSYELFYSQVPDDMKSASQGLNLLTTALGAAVNTMFQNLIYSFGWLPDDLNEGHQEYFYFIIASWGSIFLGLFVWLSQSFEYRNQTRERAYSAISPALSMLTPSLEHREDTLPCLNTPAESSRL